MKRHITFKHENPKFQAKEEHKCLLCDFKTNTNENLDIHAKARHFWKCIHCSLKTQSLSEINNHLKENHSGITYSYGTCGYETADQRILESHKLLNHDYDALRCTFCDFEAKSLFNLTEHYSVSHPLFICNEKNCHYVTHVKLKLENHLK